MHPWTIASLVVAHADTSANPVACATAFLYWTICATGMPKAEAPKSPAGIAPVVVSFVASLLTLAMPCILASLLLLLQILPVLTVTALLAAAE